MPDFMTSSGGGGGGATSVTAADGTLTITPTTGAVTAKIPSSVALPGAPTTTTAATGDATTKISTTAFVTTAVNNAIAGVNPAVAVTAATTTFLPTSPTYLNGASGIGATITAGSTNATLVIDGITPTLLQRVLIKNESGGLGAAKNGVYLVSQLAALATPWILTRALDFDQPSNINNTGAIPVISGTVNTTTSWVVSSSVATVGTDAITFAQFTVNPANIAGPTKPCVLSNIPLVTTGSAGTYICTDSPIIAVDSGSALTYYGNGGQLLSVPVYGNYSNAYGATSGITFTSTGVLGFTITNPIATGAASCALVGKALVQTGNNWTVTACIESVMEQTNYTIVGLTCWNQAGSSTHRGLLIYQTTSGGGTTSAPINCIAQSTANDFTSASNLTSAAIIYYSNALGIPDGRFAVGGLNYDKRLVWMRIVCDGVNRTYYISSDGITFNQVYQETFNNVFVADSFGVNVGEATGAGGAGTYRQAQVISLSQTSP